MTIQQIIIDKTLGISQQVVNLEGIDYQVRFAWNGRDNNWYMDISLSDDTSLAMGVKMIINYDLIGHYVEENMPPGSFMLFSEDSSPITRDNINDVCKLLYTTSDDPLLQQ